MTPQEIFDTVCKHLAQQKVRAINKESGSCMYRTPSGLKCAVGCLIPDKVYKPEMEKAFFSNLCTFDELDFLWPHKNILRALQNAHDISPDASYLRNLLIDIAKRYELDNTSANLIQEWDSQLHKSKTTLTFNTPHQ